MSDESFKNAMIELILHVDSMKLDDGTYLRVANALKEVYDKIGVIEEPSETLIVEATAQLEEESEDEQTEDESEYEIIRAAIMHDNVDTMNLILQRNAEFLADYYTEFMAIAITHVSVSCMQRLIQLRHSTQ